ncbi:hypothetical protein [Staphylococcus warneri]|uniref:hypothetical protein n=1 Tax=Staphylococcus warneri TaxID=1292 RepID=UPI0005DF9C64|nr:hypothetical protein [Staphylococcus warneri]COE64485.1 Uncharacterised protein [Staphylococcus warneri]
MGLEEQYQHEIENIVEETFGSGLPPQLKKELINDISKTGKIDVDRVTERFTDYGYFQRVSTSTESRINDYKPLDYPQTLDSIHKLEQLNQSLLTNNIKIENENTSLIERIVKQLDKYIEKSNQLRIEELGAEIEHTKHQIKSYEVAIKGLNEDKQSFQNKLFHKWFHYYDTQIEHIDELINSYENLIDDMDNRKDILNSSIKMYQHNQLQLNQTLALFDDDNPFGELDE